MKRVSVILTTYNAEAYIQKTLDAILNQEGIRREFDIELIIVDDCSTDNTLTILRQNQIQYHITERNTGGPNKGRNIGLKASTGDYICIADHDDEWNRDRLHLILPYLDRAPIVTSGYSEIDHQKGTVRNKACHNEAGYVFYEVNETFVKKLRRESRVQNTYLGGLIYNSSLKHILFEEHYGQCDYDWGLKLFHQNASIEVCMPTYKRIKHANNLSRDETYRINDYHNSLNCVEEYRSPYPAEVKLSRQRTNGSMARYYYSIGEMRKARAYFMKSEMSLKVIAYYLTTFYGSTFVKKYFDVF